MKECDSISITLKTPNDSHTISVSPICTVQELRNMVCEKFSVASVSVCLICQGKIMRDSDNFSDYSIKHNSVVHLIIKSTPKKKAFMNTTPKETVQKSQQQTVTEQSPPVATPLSGGGLFSQMDQSEDLLSISTQLLKNLPAETVEAMLLNNPSFQKLFEEYPEMRSHFTGKNLIEMLEVMSNPTMRNEAMRNYDSVMTQMQNYPGAMQMLNRLMPSQTQSDMLHNDESTPSNFNNVRPNTSGTPAPNPWESSNRNVNSAPSQHTVPSNNLPDLQRHVQALQNPIVAKAFGDIMKGIIVLQKEAPELLSSVGMSSMGNFQNLLQGTSTHSFQPQPTVQSRNPEEQYKSELDQLHEMGFKNRTMNIQALQFNEGNVDAAVDWLIRHL